MSSKTINTSPNIIIRIVWFLTIGLWLSGIWTIVAWVLCISIIGLPLGLVMLDNLPFVTTLYGKRQHTSVDARGGINVHGTPQYPFLIRAIYFVLIGSWLSAGWLAVAWLLSSSMIGLPFSFWMIDCVPAILTLARD